MGARLVAEHPVCFERPVHLAARDVPIPGARGCRLERQCEPLFILPERLLRLLAFGDVAAGIQNGSPSDRHLLDVDEQRAAGTSLGDNLVLDVAHLTGGCQLTGIDQVTSEEHGDPIHRPNLVVAVSENHVDVRADEGEDAVIVGNEDGIRHVDQRDSMQLLGFLEGCR